MSGYIEIDDMPDLGAVTDATEFVGEKAGSGVFTALALRDYTAMVGVPRAVGNNSADDTAAIQATVNAVSAAGGGVVFLRKGIYKISAAITVPLNGRVWFRGEGLAVTILRQSSPVADGIVFVRDNYLTTGGGVSDMTIEAGAGLEAGGLFGPGSTGVGLKVTRGNDNFETRGVGINNFGIGLGLYGCWNTHHHDLRVVFSATSAIHIGASGGDYGAGNVICNSIVSNNGYTGPNTTTAGITVAACGGLHLAGIEIMAFGSGVVLRPDATTVVLYVFCERVLADTCVADGWVIDGTANNVWSVYCTTCWSSFNGGHGLNVFGSHIRDMQWTAGRLRENKLTGAYLQAGGVTVTGGVIVHNSRTNDGVYPGVQVAGGVSNWSLVGVRIGNDGQATAVQGDGVKIDAGASASYRIVGCDLSLPGPGKVPLVQGSTNPQAMLSSNLPVGGNGINTYSAMVLASCSGSVVAATTTYLGPTGAQAAEGSAIWSVMRAGVVSLVHVTCTIAPGAGQSFTFMLRRNYADTGLTGTISGAGVFALDIGVPVLAITSGDTLSLRLVTSATAATAAFSYTIRVE